MRKKAGTDEKVPALYWVGYLQKRVPVALQIYAYFTNKKLNYALIYSENKLAEANKNLLKYKEIIKQLSVHAKEDKLSRNFINSLIQDVDNSPVCYLLEKVSLDIEILNEEETLLDLSYNWNIEGRTDTTATDGFFSFYISGDYEIKNIDELNMKAYLTIDNSEKEELMLNEDYHIDLQESTKDM